MKIAFPANGKVISSHFGHCVSFKVFDIDDDKAIVNQSTIENPGEHKPGVLPGVLQQYEINVLIADGIGQKAINLFNEMGIKVITGASGLIEDVLRRFLNDTLQDGGNICNH
jgi:predicted Fe-Mo cluster-binding NifX family protein